MAVPEKFGVFDDPAAGSKRKKGCELQESVTVLSASMCETQVAFGALAVGNAALVARPLLPLQKVMRGEPKPEAARADASAEDLMQAVAQRRDRTAFMRLFEHFGPRIKGYLIRQGADPASAEDLVQDVMLTVWRRAAQFDRSKAAASTWLFTIARNRRIDTLRRARRPEIDPEDPALVREPDDPADRVVEAAQRRASVHAAVAELPDDQATLLRLAYFEDKSHSVIAAELSLPLGTVKSRLRLAMGKLRAALETME
jgi:RNA polymerase sigma-70 factor (ECF subfamily)